MNQTSCPTCHEPILSGGVCEKESCYTRLKRGDKLDKYIVEEKIGEGGMGEVWRGRHTTIQKRVAIKVLNSRLLAQRVAVTRFQREAIAVNEIQHRNLVDIFDFGELPDHSPYFVMEYLEGCSLARLIYEKKTVSFDLIWHILEQVCRGLQAAHERGIIHRDLKPDNIFLVSQKDALLPFVKILDFGIAKLSANDDGQTLTKSGAVFGTPAYMSPEQCEGAKAVDARSDVYSLGIILFEMLTGRNPFQEKGEGSGLVMAKQIMTPPPKPSSLASSGILSEQLDQFVLRTLSKKPEQRPQTADQFREELQRVLEQPKTATTRFEMPPNLISTTEKTNPDASYFVVSPKSSPELAPPKKKSALSIIIPTSVVLGVLVGVLAVTFSKSAPSPTAAPPSAPQPNQITLAVYSDPAGAKVLLDGREVGVTPLIHKIPAEARSAQMVVSKESFLPFESVISLSQDATLQPKLQAPPNQPATQPTSEKSIKVTKPIKNTDTAPPCDASACAAKKGTCDTKTNTCKVKKETKDSELFVYP